MLLGRAERDDEQVADHRVRGQLVERHPARNVTLRHRCCPPRSACASTARSSSAASRSRSRGSARTRRAGSTRGARASRSATAARWPASSCMCNLAQPVPPAGELPPVSVVIPVRDRSIARLLSALDAAEVIVVDDASDDGEALRAEAEAAGARYLRRATDGRRGSGPQRRPRRREPRAGRVRRLRLRPAPGLARGAAAALRRPRTRRDRAADRRARRGARGRAGGCAARAGRGGRRRNGAGARVRGDGRVARYEAARSPLDRGGARRA